MEASISKNNELQSANINLKNNTMETTNTQTATETTGKTIHLTNEMFLEKVMDYETNTEAWVFKGDKPCLIDFYASWCGPCKIAGPILEDLAKEYEGKIDIYKVNTEQEQQLAAVFGIRSIPSFLYCPKDGKPTMASGIGRSAEETKKLFSEQIDKLLLNPDEVAQ